MKPIPDFWFVFIFLLSCQDAVDRIAPDFREQLDALEKSIALIQATNI